MKKTNIIIVIILSGLMLFSCEKFLDVQPKGTLTEDVMFNDVQGFRDAMYGVYSSMAKPHLYGNNLSYGFLDKLGQMFIYNNDQNLDVYITQYDYNNARIHAITDTIWAGQYSTISYINNIIKHIETTSLKHSDLALIEGEAHALRAFLHYDIVRLFCENYLQNNKAKGIPYAYTFDLKNKQLFSLEQTYKNILSDLTIAEILLKEDNTLLFKEQTSSLDYEKGRYGHCNKFAVKALKARVYHSLGKTDSAAYFAEQVIKAKDNFGLSSFTNFKNVKKFPAPKELIFGLNTTDITNLIHSTFLIGFGAGSCTQGRDDLYNLYEASSFTANNADVRFNEFYKEENNIYRFTRFLANDSELKTNPVKGITLIRLPEMYYILAESIYDSDQNRAINLLDEVRKSRGLQPIDKEKIKTHEHFISEIIRERMREMPGEGQIFFALKHYNRSFTTVVGSAEIPPSKEIFTLPWPQNELDFGNK